MGMLLPVGYSILNLLPKTSDVNPINYFHFLSRDDDNSKCISISNYSNLNILNFFLRRHSSTIWWGHFISYLLEASEFKFYFVYCNISLIFLVSYYSYLKNALESLYTFRAQMYA
jgi:hypothetical protein